MQGILRYTRKDLFDKSNRWYTVVAILGIVIPTVIFMLIYGLSRGAKQYFHHLFSHTGFIEVSESGIPIKSLNDIITTTNPRSYWGYSAFLIAGSNGKNWDERCKVYFPQNMRIQGAKAQQGNFPFLHDINNFPVEIFKKEQLQSAHDEAGVYISVQLLRKLGYINNDKFITTLKVREHSFQLTESVLIPQTKIIQKQHFIVLQFAIKNRKIRYVRVPILSIIKDKVHSPDIFIVTKTLSDLVKRWHEKTANEVDYDLYHLKRFHYSHVEVKGGPLTFELQQKITRRFPEWRYEIFATQNKQYLVSCQRFFPKNEILQLARKQNPNISFNTRAFFTLRWRKLTPIWTCTISVPANAKVKLQKFSEKYNLGRTRISFKKGKFFYNLEVESLPEQFSDENVFMANVKKIMPAKINSKFQLPVLSKFNLRSRSVDGKNNAYVFVNSKDKIRKTMQMIQQKSNGKLYCSSPIEPFLDIINIVEQIFRIGIPFMLVVFGLISFAIIYNCFSSMIRPKTGQIGLLKAIGLSRKQILWIYLLQAWMISIISSIIACIIGYFVGHYLGNYISIIIEIPHNFYHHHNHVYFLVIGLSFLFTTLGVFIPAKEISSKDALKAITEGKL